MIDRRHFLIGTGALLTASFVRRASAFSQRAGEPLILPSVRKPEETLYVYMQDYEFDENDEVAEYDAKWRVSLGPDQPFAPPPPVNICVRSDIASRPLTRSSAHARSITCLWKNSTSA